MKIIILLIWVFVSPYFVWPYLVEKVKTKIIDYNIYSIVFAVYAISWFFSIARLFIEILELWR